MKRDWTAFAVEPREEEQEWTVEEIPVLTARSSLPEPAAERAWGRIRRFYHWQRRSFYRYCKGELFPWAEAEAKNAMERGVPIPCFHAELTYRTTYRAGKLWSLYTELRDNAAPGPSMVRRWGDTWDLSGEFPLPPERFFPPRFAWKRGALLAAEQEIRRQERRGEACFYPEWPRLLRRRFHPRNYYLTPEGVAFFFPMESLAPAIEGIPVFLLPYCGEAPFAPLRE